MIVRVVVVEILMITIIIADVAADVDAEEEAERMTLIDVMIGIATEIATEDLTMIMVVEDADAEEVMVVNASNIDRLNITALLLQLPRITDPDLLPLNQTMDNRMADPHRLHRYVLLLLLILF